MPTLVQKDAQKFTYPAPPATNVIYVSVTGASTGTGSTVGAPVNLTRALNLANSSSAAQTIVLRGGVYDRPFDNELNKAGTVLIAYQNEFPVISGFKPITGFILENGLYAAPYSYVPTPAATDSRAVDPTYTIIKNGQFITRGDVVLKQVANKSELVANSFFIDTTANKIFTKESPAPFGGLAVVGAEYGLRINAANIQVRGIGLMGYTKGFRINGTSGVVIDRVTARYFAISAANAAVASQSTMSNCDIAYCGMVCYDGGGVVTNIVDNEFSWGNCSGFNPGWSSGGIKLTSNLISTNVNCNIRRNKVHDCKNAGIWIDINIHDQTIADNEVYNCVIGIEDEISQRNFYVNNLLRNCNVGMLVSCTEAANVWHNTFIGCTSSALVVQDWGRDRGNSESQNPKDGSWKTQATVFNNNLVIGGSTPAPYFIRTATYQNELSSDYIAQMRNNLYVKNGSIPANYTRWSSSSTAQEVLYVALEEFQQDFPNYEQGSQVVNSQPATLPNGYPMPAPVAAVFGATAGSTRAVGSNLLADSTSPPAPAVTVEELQAEISNLNDILDGVKNERDRLATDVAAAKEELRLTLAKLNSVKSILQADATTQALNIIG